MTIAHSHPELEERGSTKAPRITYPANDILRKQATIWAEQPGNSRAKLAGKLGISTSAVSQYLNPEGCVYPGDIASLEKKLMDFLANESRRRASGVETVECNVTKQIRQGIEYIRETNDLGCLLAKSGEGKSRGVDAFVRSNPTATLLRCSRWMKTEEDVVQAFWAIVNKNGYDGRTKRAIWIVNQFANTDRLFIFDDAHKLTPMALQWVIDFHDATGCPIPLIGTYLLEDKLEADSQRLSRVGLRWEIMPEGGARELIDHLIQSLTSDVGSEMHELRDLCEQIANHAGKYRAIHKQLKLSAELKAKKPKLTWCEAFKAAHTLLMRKQQLN